MPTDPPEADATPPAPHPRYAPGVIGQDAALCAFAAAAAAGRLHHGWALVGPQGVGKATLAWAIARHLLAGAPLAPAPLGTAGQGRPADAAPAVAAGDAEDQDLARIAALAHPGLFLIRRDWDPDRQRLRAVIGVDSVRGLGRFMGLSRPDGGWRVVIIDAADDMTTEASNALLKHLEEPPERCVFLLVCHRPSALLPTIRSRLRTLSCAPLTAEALARVLAGAGLDPGPEADGLAVLASGSAGAAVRLLAEDGVSLYARIVAILSRAPGLLRQAVLELAAEAAAPAAAARYGLILDLCHVACGRLALAGAGRARGPEAATGEAALLARLSPGPDAARIWADCAQTIAARQRHGRSVNLDPAGVILDTFLAIDAAAARASARAA